MDTTKITTSNVAHRNTAKAVAYVNSIRNPEKMRYALEYANFLIGEHTEPPSRGALSYMAAQAVRLTLDPLLA